MSEIDQQLQDSSSKISSFINAEEDNIDISKIDSRQLSSQISFQVVNRFNKVLFQSNNVNTVTRMPVFIDRRYIDSQLKGQVFKEVKDSVNQTRYLVLTEPLLNDKG